MRTRRQIKHGGLLDEGRHPCGEIARVRAPARAQLHRKQLCEVLPALFEGGAVWREPARRHVWTGGGLLGRAHAGRGGAAGWQR
eukprot:7533458-Heterocapsa_arctica.AAC.1